MNKRPEVPVHLKSTLSLPEAEAMLSAGREWILACVSNGNLRPMMIGTKKTFARAELEAFNEWRTLTGLDAGASENAGRRFGV